jgi:hypothetical protein
MMDKVIRADIDCLLAKIRIAVNENNYRLALEATSTLSEAIGKLVTIDQLRRVSNEQERN